MNAHSSIKADAFDRYQDAARALLLADADLSPRQGQFLGGLMFSAGALTEKQEGWLAGLLKRAGLPALADGGGRG